jgi:hypothetical protein
LSDPTDELLPVRPVPAAGSDPEEFQGAFRETFLAETRDPEAHAVIRAFGKVLNNFALESSERWPYSHLDSVAYRLQAGLADLRHLQDFFAFWGEQEPIREPDNDETKRHYAICQLSAQIAQRLEEFADDLEKEVGDWKFGRPRS